MAFPFMRAGKARPIDIQPAACRNAGRALLLSLTLLPLAAGPIMAAPADDGDTPAFITEGESANANAALLRYQLALDQLSQGNLLEARVLLNEARRRGGDSPEINLLLSYVLQREGKMDEATRVLQAAGAESPLTQAQERQLRIGGVAPALNKYPDIDDDGLESDGESLPEESGTDEARDSRVPVASNSGRDRPGNQGGATVAASNARAVASVSQPDARLRELENYLVEQVNAERKRQGLKPLASDSMLADTSRAHSLEMRDRKYFAHESPTDSLRQPLDRYRAVFKRTPNLVAENIYRSWGSPHRPDEKDIRGAHDALMKSPGHRANILLPEAVRIGIGIVSNANGDIWVTQMFARG